MASKFTITAELNLQTKNLNQVVNNLKQQFQGADLNIKIKDLAKAESSLRNISSGAKDASASMGMLGGSINQAFRRFTVVTLATGTIVGFTRALKNAVGDAIEFERELVKIAQATGQSVSQLRGLATEVGNVSSSFGVSSKELILAARSLTQAGFAADKVTGSLKVLAQTELAATFDSISNTTEGAIAILNQFGKQAQKTGTEVAFLEKSFSAINQVSKEFAVESSDLVTAVRTTGAAFESAGGNLNELLALFTSVRSTTRESAESISTGFRTIFTRVQRVDTINNLKALGIQLQDVEGKFVGPMEATKRLSTALSSIDPRDFRFNLIVEELGGFRQVSKVIPLIQQFATTQKALNVAQGSSGSLAKDAQTAQLSLAVQISKTREEFLRFIRDLTETESFQGTVRTLLNMANAFIKVADTIKPLIPLLGAFAALRIGQSILPAIASVAGSKGNRKADGGMIHKFASGGLVPGSGNGDTVPAMLTPGEFVIKKSSVKSLGVDNLARVNKYAGGGRVTFVAPPNKYGVFALEPEGSADTTRESTGIRVSNKDTAKILRNKAKSRGLKGITDETEVGVGGKLGVFHIGNDANNNIRDTFKASTNNAFNQMITNVSNDVSQAVGAGPIHASTPSLKNSIESLFRQDQKSAKNAIEGYVLEGVISTIGNTKLAGGQENWDFPNPKGAAKNLAKLFGQEKAISELDDADAKRTVNDSAMESVFGTKLANTFANDNAKSKQAAIVMGKASKESAAKERKRTLGDLVKELEPSYANQTFNIPGSPYGGKLSVGNIANILKGSKSLMAKGLTASSPIDDEGLENVIVNALANDESLRFPKKALDQKKALGGLIHFASGGEASGTDTVPAMLTPGEYVINKKSAQSIGYGALNRMNKVGKFAQGGPVQFLNNGGVKNAFGNTTNVTAQPFANFVTSTANPYPSTPPSGPTIDVLSSALEQSAKTIGQGAEKVTNKFGDLNDQLLLFGPAIAGAVAQMGMFDKATADMISASTATFSVIQGVGGNLAQQAGKMFGVSESSKLFKGLNAGIAAYALSQSAAAARVQSFGQTVETQGKKFASFVESLSNGPGANKEQMNEALLEQFKAASQAQTRQSGIVKAAGAIGTAIGTVGGGYLGGLSSAGTMAVPGAIAGGAVVGTAAEEVAAYAVYGESLQKVTEQANALSSAMYSATDSNREFQKFNQNIDKQSPEKIAQQSAKLAAAYKLQSDELAKFNSNDLANASDSVKQQFQAVSEAAKLTAKNLQNIIGAQLQRAVKRSGQLVSEGYMPDNEKLIQPVLNAIKNKVEAEYAQPLAKARTEDEKAGITAARDTQVQVEQNEARRTLEESTKQQLEMTKALVLENNIRKDLIGSMQKQLAVSAAIERTAYELDRVSKTVSHIDAVFSGSLTGLKSSYDPAVLKMKSPDQGRLNNALAPVRAIGPAGKDLSDNILNINKVMPNLETKLLEFSKATDTASGSLFNVSDFVKTAFDIDPNSLVGKTLVNIVEGVTRGTAGGSSAVTASSTSLREPEVRKRIAETFQKFGEEFKTQASGIIENLNQAEQEGRAIAEKINESRQRQLELALQAVDTFSQYVDAISKARGRDLSLMEKNTIRNMRQFTLAGPMGNNSAALGARLNKIYTDLNKGGLNPEDSAKLSFEARNLTKALEGLANQSDKTSDVLQEIDKVKKNRENLRELGREFGTGTAEDKAKMQQDMQAAMTVAMTGSYDSIPEEMRKGADAMLERFKDIPFFKQAQNRAIADTFMQAGNPLAAQMVMQETSTPEQMLIRELDSIFARQIAAQQKLSIVEGLRQTFLEQAQKDNTKAISNLSELIKQLIEKFQAEADQKAVPVDEKKMAQEKFLLSGPAAGLSRSGMRLAPGGGLVSPEISAIPQDAKAKIDTESVVALNASIASFDDNIVNIDATIGQLNTYLQNLKDNLVLLDKVFEAKKKKKEEATKPIVDKFGQAIDPDLQRQANIKRLRDAGFTDEEINLELQTRNRGGLIYRAGGGSIFQPKGTDTVPAMLTPGEFVIKKSSVDKIGTDTLSKINAGGYASGGLVSYLQMGGLGGGAKWKEEDAGNLQKRIQDLEKRVKVLEKENDSLAKLLKIFGFGDVRREVQNNNGQMANQAQPINNPIQNMRMMARGPAGGTARSKARRNVALRAEDKRNDKINKEFAERETLFSDIQPELDGRPKRNFRTPEEKQTEADKLANDRAIKNLTFVGPPTKAENDIAQQRNKEQNRAEEAKKRVAEADAAETRRRDQQGQAPAPADQTGRKVRPANSIYTQAQWDAMQKKADEEKALSATRAAAMKKGMGTGSQVKTDEGYRDATPEEIQAKMLKKYGPRPAHISEEDWLKQINKAEDEQSSAFFEGVKKKGVKSKFSDYGQAPTSPYTEKTQEALDKAKALSAAADAQREKEFGNKPGQGYKSEADIPVLRPSQVGELVTPNSLKETQAQASQPAIPSRGVTLTPAEELANKVAEEQPDQYVNKGSLPDYLNAKGRILANQAVANRVNEAQMQAGVANPESRAESFANSFATKSKEMMSPIAPVTIPNKLTELESLKKKNPLSMFADGGYVGYFGRGGRARMRANRRAPQTSQQRLREVNAQIDLMTGTREVLPTTQDPYAPPIGVTSTGKGETGPRGLEGANQLQALDQERQELMASRESAKIGPQPVSEFRKNEQARIDAKYTEKSANVDKEMAAVMEQAKLAGKKVGAEGMARQQQQETPTPPAALTEMKKVESIGANSNPAQYAYGDDRDQNLIDLKAKYDAESKIALDADNMEEARRLGDQYTRDRMILEAKGELPLHMLPSGGMLSSMGSFRGSLKDLVNAPNNLPGLEKVEGTGESVDKDGNKVDTTYGISRGGVRAPTSVIKDQENQRLAQEAMVNAANPVDEKGAFGHFMDGMMKGRLMRGLGSILESTGMMPTDESVNKRVEDTVKEEKAKDVERKLEDHRNRYKAMGLHLGGLAYLANGGSPKGTDTVPAMLTPGEFVMKKEAVDKHGTSFMEKLNSGGVVPGFADGGMVSYFNRGASVGIRNQTMELSNRWKSMMANNPAMQQINGAWNNAAGQMQGAVNNAGSQMQGAVNNTYAQMGMNPAAGFTQQVAGGVGQVGGGAEGGGQANPAMPDMKAVTEALNNMSTAFTGFATQLQTLANSFNGLTVTHNIVLGGQVNVTGVDGPELQKAVEKYANNVVQKQIAANNNNSGQTKLGKLGNGGQ